MEKGLEGNSSPAPSGKDTLRLLRGMALDSRLVLVIRHAERDESPREDRYVPLEKTRKLTSNGRESSRLFGRELPPFGHLFMTHTVVPRSRDTAEEISAGFRETHPDGTVESAGVGSRPGTLPVLRAKSESS